MLALFNVVNLVSYEPYVVVGLVAARSNKGTTCFRVRLDHGFYPWQDMVQIFFESYSSESV